MSPSSRLASASLGVSLVAALVGCSAAGPGGSETPSRTTATSAPPAGATSTPSPTPTDDAAAAPTGTPRVIATGLDLPWSLVRLESGATLVSERDTALVKEISTAGDVRTVGEVPGVAPGGEGGLLGLAVSPDDPTSLYAYTSTSSDNRVLRIDLTGDAGGYGLGDAETVIDGIPRAGNHNGGRLAFGPDNMLYVTTGDAGNTANSQNPDSLGGKILRLDPSGAIPADNPFPGSPVFTLGHRNPQGIAWDAAGNMFASEFGQNTWDEFNQITAGSNYGWPAAEGIAGNPDFVDPLVQWSPRDASPSGLSYADGTFFLAALRGERLWTLDTTPLDPSAVPPTASFFEGDHGRLRDVVRGPGDTLWLLTNNTGRSPRPGDDQILEVDLG